MNAGKDHPAYFEQMRGGFRLRNVRSGMATRHCHTSGLQLIDPRLSTQSIVEHVLGRAGQLPSVLHLGDRHFASGAAAAEISCFDADMFA